MKNATTATAVVRKNRGTGMEFIDLNSLVEGGSDSPANARAKAEKSARYAIEWLSANPVVRTSTVVIGEITARQMLTRRY